MTAAGLTGAPRGNVRACRRSDAGTSGCLRVVGPVRVLCYGKRGLVGTERRKVASVAPVGLVMKWREETEAPGPEVFVVLSGLQRLIRDVKARHRWTGS